MILTIYSYQINLVKYTHEVFIYNLDVTKDEKGIILYGHSDPIHFMKLIGNIIVTCDTFGKVKICDFPNVFNVRSALFYDNE